VGDRIRRHFSRHIGYVFVTGFYQKFTKEGLQDLDVFDVEEARRPRRSRLPRTSRSGSPSPSGAPRRAEMAAARSRRNSSAGGGEAGVCAQTARADTVGERGGADGEGLPGYPGQAFRDHGMLLSAPPVLGEDLPAAARPV
jgi:hypothetical protein